VLNSLHRFHGLNSLNFTYKRGQAIRGGQISLRYGLNTRRQTYRVAVVVSKKVDKSAVVRNQIRRRVYEAFRAEAATVTSPFDLIFTIFDVQVASVDMTQLRKQIAELLRRAGVRGSSTPAGHGIVDQKKTEES
jgi:ribonuclease P protein component